MESDKKWVVVSKDLSDPSSPGMGIGVVSADSSSEALAIASETYMPFEGNVLEVSPYGNWEHRIITPLSRRKDMRKDHLTHNIPLGAVVDVHVNQCYESDPLTGISCVLKGTARMYVVAHGRDCDGTPLYTVAAKPIAPPLDGHVRIFWESFVSFHLNNVNEEEMTDTGIVSARGMLTYENYYSQIIG